MYTREEAGQLVEYRGKGLLLVGRGSSPAATRLQSRVAEEGQGEAKGRPPLAPASQAGRPPPSRRRGGGPRRTARRLAALGRAAAHRSRRGCCPAAVGDSVLIKAEPPSKYPFVSGHTPAQRALRYPAPRHAMLRRAASSWPAPGCQPTPPSPTHISVLPMRAVTNAGVGG